MSDEELLAAISAETAKLRELRADIARERSEVEVLKSKVEAQVKDYAASVAALAEFLHVSSAGREN